MWQSQKTEDEEATAVATGLWMMLVVVKLMVLDVEKKKLLVDRGKKSLDTFW